MRVYLLLDASLCTSSAMFLGSSLFLEGTLARRQYNPDTVAQAMTISGRLILQPLHLPGACAGVATRNIPAERAFGHPLLVLPPHYTGEEPEGPGVERSFCDSAVS